MKLNNVLVLHKKSIYQIQAEEFKDERFIELLNQGHESVRRVKIAHEEHMATIAAVKQELDKRGIKHKQLARVDLNFPVMDADLMISVGGDGTFLDASHFLEGVPLLGVNSSSSSSFGHFCLAKEINFGAVLDGIMDDTIKLEKILRMELTLNDKKLTQRPLNEILISHSHPAATSRYLLEIDGEKEEQRSSGIWIGTPAGSTGSLRSAGGVVQKITEEKLQYIVREPYIRPNDYFSHLSGFLTREQKMEIVCQMRTGKVFIDGQHIEYEFHLGDKLTVQASPQDLNAFVDPNVNDMFQARHLADMECGKH